MKHDIVCSFVGLAKLFLAGFITLFFRLITPLLGLPNVTPLMATELACTRAYGPWIGGLYAATGIVAFDIITDTVSLVTFWASLCYMIIGISASNWMRGRCLEKRDFLVISILGTLFFDLVTGVLIVPLQPYHQSMAEALVGQIPFTLYHLMGNVFFAQFIVWFYSQIMANPALEFRFGAKIT